MTQEGYETIVRRLAERRAFVQKRLSEMQQYQLTSSEFEKLADDKQSSKELKLLAGIKKRLTELSALLADMNGNYEDGIYRFYHGSFKVDYLQSLTEHAVEIVFALAPNPSLDPRFVRIMLAGTGKEFLGEKGEVDPDAPRHVVEAFCHARYFVEMLCKYGEGENATKLEESLHRLTLTRMKPPPYSLEEFEYIPSGWAAVMELYHIR